MEGSRTCYRKRGEQSEEKIKSDILIGAMGEWGVYSYLTEKGLTVDKPDMRILAAKSKSFSADLKSESHELFHVKTQSELSASRYGDSWLLQRSDKLLKQPSERDYVVLCSAGLDNIQILAIILMKDLVDGGMLSECKVPYYRMTKLALYLDEIKKTDIDLWRF